MTTQARWRALNGSSRIMAEQKHMQQLIKDGSFPQVSELVFVQDQVHVWQFKLRNFDNDQPGGAQLNKDLQSLKQRYGQDYILMEVRFPDNYPTQPFFLRVVKPRMIMYTGHVTAGGSICIESLTLSGRPSGWQSYYSVETVLLEVLANMIDTPVVYIQTPTGPGGLTGPLRVDFNHGLREYGLEEAKSAFARTEANHRAMGWGNSIALEPPLEPDVEEMSQVLNGMAINNGSKYQSLDAEAQQARQALCDVAKRLGYVEPPHHWSLCSNTANGQTTFYDLPITLYFANIKNNGVGTSLVTCGVLDVNTSKFDIPSGAAAVTSSSTMTTTVLTKLGLTAAEADILQQMFCGNVELAEQWVKAVGVTAARQEIQRNEQLAKQKITDEIKAVLNMFEAYGGITADHVKRIERVQNLKLWARYQNNKASMSGNELQVFHGTGRGAVTAITNTGFKMRYSKHSQKMYFAQCSGYSHGYSQSKSATTSFVDASHTKPAYLDGHLVMLLCNVVGGQIACSTNNVYTINDDDYAYPAYIIHYK